MQNKGAIRFFTIVLALVSVYQLLFTVFAQKVERDAREIANGDVRIERSYLDSMKGEVVYNVLFKKYTYQDCKEREVNLGLDLKGGMNVTLEVSIGDIVRGLSGSSQNPTFLEAMALTYEKQKDSQKDFVTLFEQPLVKEDSAQVLQPPLDTFC